MAVIAGGASRGIALRWPTPNASLLNYDEQPESFRASAERLEAKHHNSNGAGLPLGIAAQEMVAGLWPTATAKSEAQTSDNPTPAQTGGTTLPGAARQIMENWLTPSVADTTGGHLSRGGDRSTELLLPGMAQKVTRDSAMPSPASRDYRSPNSKESQESRGRDVETGQQLPNFVAHYLSGPLAQPIAGAGTPFSLGGRGLRPQLSALFVEWLMGLPLGWSCVCVTEATASEDSATQLSRPKRKPRSVSSGSARLGSGPDAS